MIEFQHVGKSYKNQKILKDINFTIKDGEFVCFIGPSGCGKTTTLKMMNLLITPSEGNVLINGEKITNVNPVQLRRQMGYVIQQTGLFPHLTVRENIEIISRLEKKKPKELLDRTKELLEMVGLDSELYMNQFPIQLSGGQQQRVGVARALARNPEIILMDEPFSALDPITRSQLQDELLSLQESVKKTIVFVTHDMEEAVKMADRICIMQDGHIAQFNTPEEIMKHPANEFVQSFVGKNRIWDSPELIHANDIMIENPITSPSNATIMQAISIMQRKNVDTVLLVNSNKKFLGVVDGLTAMRQSDKMRPAKDIIKEEMYTVSPEESIVDILLRSKEENIYTVPVVEDGILKGLITKSTLVTALSQKYESEGEEDA